MPRRKNFSNDIKEATVAANKTGKCYKNISEQSTENTQDISQSDI